MRTKDKWLAIAVAISIAQGSAGLAQYPGCDPATPLACDNSGAWPSCSNGSTAYTWRCWQKELISSQSYTNGYRDVKVVANLRWQQNPAIQHNTFAYWAGKTADGLHDRFVFRTAFPPFSGAWTWSTSCTTQYGSESCSADSGLVTTGSVNVAAQFTTNPLWTRGLLKQDSVYALGVTTFRPISHYDGTYFFWHGDTAWAATAQACRNQWRSYVDNRKANGVTVVHLALSSRWAGPPATGDDEGILSNMSGGQASFEQVLQACPSEDFDREEKYPNCQSRWNPAYWTELDGMIQYANQEGLVVYLVGVAEPYERWMSNAAIKVFARNLAAMTRGNFVLLSPGFDGDPTACEPYMTCPGNGRYLSKLQDVAGDEIRTLSGVYPQIVNHYGTVNATQMAGVHSESWLNMNGYQSGHNGGQLSSLASRPKSVAQAVRYATSGAFKNPKKPAINAEAIYDYGYGVSSEAATSATHHNRYRARQAGYSSWLAGATGYSWGNAGLWEWGICGQSPIPGWAVAEQTCQGGSNPVPQTDDYTSYAGSMCSEDATDSLRLLGDAMRTVDFAVLAAGPSEQNRASSVPQPLTYRQFALARDADTIAVYLPYNEYVRVELGGTGLESGFSAAFFNPWDPDFLIPASCSHVSGTKYEFDNPQGIGEVGKDDWVLAIFPGAGIPCDVGLAGFQGSELHIFAAESEERIRGLWAWPGDDSGASEPTLIEAVGGQLPRKWVSQRDAQGNTLVVWEHRRAFGTLSQLHGRWLDPGARPLGEVFGIAPVADRDQLAPSVGMGSSGEGVVAWIERDPATGEAQVLALDLSPAGAAEREPNRLDREGVLVPRRTRVGCTPESKCVVAWEEEDRLTGAVTARYVTVDSQAVRVTSDELVLRSAPGELWLGRPELDSEGRIVLSWEEFDASGESRGRFAAFVDGERD